MNLQILSNTVLDDGGVNYTNEFEMKLAEPIDAINHDAFFELTEISYPGTTKNISDDSCWFSFKIYIGNSKKVAGGYYDAADLSVTSDKFIIPEGCYTLEQLLRYLNNALNEYDVAFLLTAGGKVKITEKIYVEYWANQGKTTRTVNGVKTADDGEPTNYYHMVAQSVTGINAKFCVANMLTFSKKLAFMLGLVNEIVWFKQWNIPCNGITVYDTTQEIVANHLPDISDGLDKMFVYCDELERSFIGDSSAELVSTVPIHWSEQGKGNGELIIYTPSVPVKRKFKKACISSLHIAIKDAVGVKVPFDSGTVSIEGVVHYA